MYFYNSLNTFKIFERNRRTEGKKIVPLFTYSGDTVTYEFIILL